MAHSMIHTNGHIIAAVDVETTGLRPRYHDVIQVCVMPLNANFDPLEGIMPFYASMKPKRPENIDPKALNVSRTKLSDILLKALDADRIADFFDEWYKQLPLPSGKQLMPLAHNWPFDREFMIDWLGFENFNHYFNGHYRDLMAAGIYENDKAAFHVEPYPYPKHGLKYYSSQLGVQNPNPHDAMGDCFTTARCYKKVVLAGYLTPVAKQPENLE